MSAFTERGASSSSINLMNSSTRLPEGAAMQKPRTGKVLSASSSAAARFKVPTSSRQIQFFAKFDFEVMFDISMVGSSSVQTHRSGGACRLRDGGLGRFRSVFRLDDLAHEFGRELGVLVRELDSHCFAIHHGQLMAKLVADVTAIADLMHRPREVSIVLVRLACDDSVDSIHAGDAAVRVTLKLSPEVRHHLHGTDRLRSVAHRRGALVGHQGRIETDLELW